jgi:hypothetical protein
MKLFSIRNNTGTEFNISRDNENKDGSSKASKSSFSPLV